MTDLDKTLLAITAWRENRGGNTPGMQSVINVICNRANARSTTPYEECVRPWQFSSITAKGDPELILWPAVEDAAFTIAQDLANMASLSALADITLGATSYYALSMKEPPAWAATMTKTVEIAGQIFFK